MAATTAVSPSQIHLVPARTAHAHSNLFATRQITSGAGRALELLAHAIEYLTDEHVWRTQAFAASDPDVKAIQILMAANRQVYFECPLMPTVGERLRAFFGRCTA